MKLKFDLHLHSRYSFDSNLSIKKIIAAAKRSGLDGIAITDHEEFSGAEEAERVSGDFLVIKGEEIDTEFGDVIGLFLKKKIYTKVFSEVIKEIREQGGIVVLPHPAEHHVVTSEVLKEVDLIEIFNSRVGKASNDMARRLAKKGKKVAISGSDAHFDLKLGMV